MIRICRRKINLLIKRNNCSLFIGVCIGISFSLFLTPFLSNHCSTLSNHFINGIKLSSLKDKIIIDQESEDFEPTVTLNEEASNIKSSNDKPSKLIRPRYYSTELGMKDKVLVSVISSKESIATFGVAINKTLSHYIDKLIFFLDGTGSKKLDLHIPIVGFKEHKPLIKIFRILSYISEHYIEDFNYFMFVNDHTYINGKKLMLMLEKISVSLNIHMGKIQNEDMYCDIDSGIILSQSIIKAVSKELLWCTKHTFSDSDTDNLGRCILHTSNLPCKSVYQNQIYDSVSLKTGQDPSLISALDAYTLSKFDEALTISNLMSSEDIFHLHIHALQHFILHTKSNILDLRDEVVEAMEGSPLVTETWPIGSPESHVPPTRHDLIFWETFNSTHMFMPNDFDNIKPLTGVDGHDIKNVLESSVAHLLTTSAASLQFSKLQYGHRRLDPSRGVDYKLALEFIDSRGKIVLKKVEAYRGATQPEVIPMPYLTESTAVTVVVPVVEADVKRAVAFVEMFEKNVKADQMTLYFCLLSTKNVSSKSNEDPFKALKEKLSLYSEIHYASESRATSAAFAWPADLLEFMPALAFVDLATRKMSPDTLLLVIPNLGAFIDTDFINRVRMNTIRGWQVFLPIPYTRYHPDLLEDTASYFRREINALNGHFDRFAYDIASFYVDDYVTARHAMDPRLPLIRFDEDLVSAPSDMRTSLHDLFLRTTDLHVMRAIEPSLVLQYSAVHCPDNKESTFSQEEVVVCERRRALSLGPRRTLSKLVYEAQQAQKKEEPNS